jgi:protoporphyrinogen oxidase
MMWEAFRDRVEEKGGEVRMEQKVRRIFREGNKVRAVEVENADGSTYEFEADEFISSMPISALVENMVPPAPDHVVEAARKLRYRDFLMVTLIIEGENMFPDNWIYIHSPDVKVGRIQNFRSWSEEMIPEENRSSLGMEYFCNENDELWDKDDKELLAQAERELRTLNLVGEAPVLDGKVIRQRKAYPLYDSDYRDALETIREWLATISNLQAVGRNGMHRYNNQDHSMLTAMLAVKNILGEKHDLWAVNVEEEYHEEVSEPEPEGGRQVMGHSERLQPTRILEGTK